MSSASERKVARIKASLVRIIDDSFPVFGAFTFTDAFGEAVVIHEKLPVVGVDDVDGRTALPIVVLLRCTVVTSTDDVVVIDTSDPDGMEDVRGRTRFRIHADRLV